MILFVWASPGVRDRGALVLAAVEVAVMVVLVVVYFRFLRPVR
jgi:hypothetical protein